MRPNKNGKRGSKWLSISREIKKKKKKKFDDAFNSGPIPNKTLNRDRDPFPLTFLGD